MGNTLKLVSGFILFVFGALMAYETSVYNLLDILLIVGFIIAIVGVILIVSYFVDTNADRTTNMLKDLINSGEFNAPSLGKSKDNSKLDEGPLRVRRDYNDDIEEYDELVLDDFEGISGRDYYEEEEEENPKAVLNVVKPKEHDFDFDKKLKFTPNYDKPLKVTRSPKKREGDYFQSEVPHIKVEQDKSDDIKRALLEDSEETLSEPARRLTPELEKPREIKIDVNDPESLPVPKLLRSYVICDSGVVSSQEAFDQLAVHVNKEIMLEIPSLNDLSDRFLSHVPTIYSRVIIDEFDVTDMSYMFLVSSLLKQGVHIKTVPKVHTVNLITDDSHAMIISEGQNDMEYGAVYNDRNSISSIRADFEKTWDIASNLDETVLASVG